ncbi:MAG TPA: nitroreductase/quinone reductase family protein [Solirubrobacteraceae bacterium]|jgi:deazaflavin-dependent oxidoreductase (nitroreductase family)
MRSAATGPTTLDQTSPASTGDTNPYGDNHTRSLERKGNPFTRSLNGGRTLSALMLPFFLVRPPSGFGVLTTTGRRTGKTRRKCIHAVRAGNKAYVVMIRPTQAAIEAGSISAWVLNIRADPHVRLRIRGGTFAGVARELRDTAERQLAEQTYCETINPFDYVECTFHRNGRPTRAKIAELHRNWFEYGIPLEIDLQSS